MKEINMGSRMTEIGAIPENWEVMRLGNEKICRIVMGQSPPSSTYNKLQEGLPFLQGNMEFGEIYPSPSIYCSEPTKIAEKNDVLISVRAPVGEVNISSSRVCIGRGLAAIRCRPNKTNDLFLFYYLKHMGKKLENISAGSTFKAIRKNDLDQLEILLPPLPEQKKIAEILSTVDQAIEKVDQAIEKTQRIKRGLMQELLSKGIGHKEFKETEIGRIPKDWNIVRISDIADVKGGKRLPKGQKLVNSKTAHPYIRVLDFKNMGVDVGNVQFLPPETHKSIKQYIISSNDVYISIAGTVGIVGLIPSELDNANLTENAAKLCNLRNITKEFLAYFLNSNIGQNQISVYLGKAQQPKLALFRIEKIEVSLPSIPEQQKIAEILSAVDDRLGLLRKRKERLEKIKKGLMNDLLTGKVRVTSLISEEIPMREIEEIKNNLRESMPILRDKYKVKTIGIFGSYIRGEQGKGSDIDILVEFYETIDLFKFIELENFLSETLSIKVDLVMKDTLKPRIRDSILREAVTV